MDEHEMCLSIRVAAGNGAVLKSVTCLPWTPQNNAQRKDRSISGCNSNEAEHGERMSVSCEREGGGVVDPNRSCLNTFAAGA
jgi:hypothetical protein